MVKRDTFHINDLAVFDVHNKTKRKQFEKLYIVKILDIKYVMFRRVYWVMDLENLRKFWCKHNLLTRIDPLKAPAFVRFPDDAPEITREDLVIIENIYELIKNNEILAIPIRKLKSKLSYYCKNFDI